MRRVQLWAGVTVAALVAAGGGAAAATEPSSQPAVLSDHVITFDGFAGQSNQVVAQVGTSGFTFTSADFSNSELLVTTPSNCDFGGCIADGAPYIGEQGSAPGRPIVAAQQHHKRFKLLGFSAGPLYADARAAAAAGVPDATQILVVGTKPTGAQVSATFTLEPGSFRSFTLPTTFRGLKSVTFYGNDTGNSGAIALDNIHVTYRA